MNLVLYYIIFSILFICLVLSLIVIYISRENFTSGELNQPNSNNLIKSPMKFTQQLDFLTYSKFKPECCPSVYSSSRGCLCFDYDEDISIITRGDNRYFTKNDCYIKSITRARHSSK